MLCLPSIIEPRVCFSNNLLLIILLELNSGQETCSKVGKANVKICSRYTCCISVGHISKDNDRREIYRTFAFLLHVTPLFQPAT